MVIKKEDMKRVVIYMVAFSCYIFIVPVIGFFVTTTLFTILIMMFLKVKKMYMILIISIGIDLFVYEIFSIIMKVPLPSGLLF